MALRPTLKDVAARAGVATTTVARVIKGGAYVADETRQRVENAIRDTGYRVNSIARSLKSDRSYIIGHLLRSTVPNPFHLRVARGVEEYVQERGYTALTYNTEVQAETERRAIETFIGWRADGIIFTTAITAENVKYAAASGIPVVQVERPVTRDASRIVVRNYPAAKEAMAHLLQLGHRRIAYVGVEPDQRRLAGYVERERFHAYRETMVEAGLSIEGLVRFGVAYEVDVASAQGHGSSATEMLLATALRPTAIFASNDILAAGAMQAIYRAGLRIPDDISVVGFDDTLAQYVSPLLTTVRLPARQLGMAAAKLIIEDIEGLQPAGRRELVLDAEFVRRESTGLSPSQW